MEELKAIQYREFPIFFYPKEFVYLSVSYGTHLSYFTGAVYYFKA